MRLRVDRLFLDQAATYGLAVGCERCAHFDGPSAADAERPGRCAHGYPNEEHRREAFEREGREASFCKEWELA